MSKWWYIEHEGKVIDLYPHFVTNNGKVYAALRQKYADLYKIDISQFSMLEKEELYK